LSLTGFKEEEEEEEEEEESNENLGDVFLVNDINKSWFVKEYRNN